MKLRYIDIHSHLNLSPLFENKEAVLARMQEHSVGTITVGTTLETSRKAIEIAEQNPELCWATVGIHPCECIPTPTLPQGEGDTPLYLTGDGSRIKELLIQAKEMRKNPTPAEEKLWKILKGHNLGSHFRRQHIIDYFIVDFVCLSKNIIIEADGEVHNSQKERDRERDTRLKTLGFDIIRFSNEKIVNQTQLVTEEIKQYLNRRTKDSFPLGEGRGGDILELEQLACHPSVVAIGETGLDYFRNPSQETIAQQKELFKQHIELAQQVNKPLMLHVRASKGTDDAYYEALEILKDFDPLHDSGEGGSAQQNRVRTNFHFFSGSVQCMQDIIAAGFTISVDGPITFTNEYDDMIRACPLDKIMIETDAPFAAPVSYRGKTCEPWMVVEVCKKIAEIKGLDEEAVRLQVLENTSSFFGINLV
jgi:TatD family hydrolase